MCGEIDLGKGGVVSLYNPLTADGMGVKQASAGAFG